MSLADRLFGRGVKLDLPAVQAAFAAAAARPTDPELARARLADACRDAGVAPPTPEEFGDLAVGLDEEAPLRLAVFVAALDVAEVRAALRPLLAARPAAELVAAAFTGLARETPLLTPALVRESPLRAEELARRFVAALGAAVRGESADVSRKRLERLDYGRLLAEAERAQESAKERAAKLRQLQDEQEKRRPRRGKW
jgi:hypothetical protein